MDQNDRKRDERDDAENLDEAMERDTEIRRDTQVRGSLGIPPSGEEEQRPDNEESIPEFDRTDDEDRMSER